MKAYIVESSKVVEPFGDYPRECLILNRSLAERQEETLARCGVAAQPVSDVAQVRDADEHIVIEGSLYFTPEVLQEFLSRSRKLQCPTVAALKRGRFTARTVVATQDVKEYPDRVEYGLRYVPRDGQRADACRAVVIDPGDLYEALPMPTHMFGRSEYDIPLTEKVLVQVDHWANLWVVNLTVILAELARLKKGPKGRLLWLAVKARSTNQWSVLRQVNKIGRGCRIHPSAYVEGSTIGNNVTIEAGAVVRESAVGDGAFIGDQALLHLAVVGHRCFLMNGATVQYSVLYPGAFTFAKAINVSLCGRDTFLGDGVTLEDFRFDGEYISVMKNGVKVNTGQTFLGSCLGHGVYLGSGCLVAPGRAIPNGLRIAASEERTLSSFTQDVKISGYRLIEKTGPEEKTA